jgi:hypothetical protein
MVINCYAKRRFCEGRRMTINRVLTLAAIFVVATVLAYVFGFNQRQSRQPRIFVATIPTGSNVDVAEVTKYLQTACPDMVVIKDEPRADYKLAAVWAGGKWRVLVDRKDQTLILFEDHSPDAIETFRHSCQVIRDDSKEVADFDAHTAPMPIGRYSLTVLPGSQNVINSERIFLLDTKTGAVWEWKSLGDHEEFERISVEGLYNRKMFER